MCVLTYQGLTASYPIHSPRDRLSALLLVAVLSAAIAAALATLLLIASLAERFGIRAIARVHRWRLPPDAATALIAHASHAWPPAATIALPAPFARALFGSADAPALVLLAALAVGLVWFEAVVYFGLRANKFANWPSPRAG